MPLPSSKAPLNRMMLSRTPQSLPTSHPLCYHVSSHAGAGMSCRDKGNGGISRMVSHNTRTPSPVLPILQIHSPRKSGIERPKPTRKSAYYSVRGALTARSTHWCRPSTAVRTPVYVRPHVRRIQNLWCWLILHVLDGVLTMEQDRGDRLTVI
jgi:hypothetical protein